MQTFRRWASSCLLVTVSVYQGFLPAVQAQEAATAAGTPVADSNNRSVTTLGDLTVAAGETRIVDFTSSGVLDISGSLTNQGTLLFISSNNQVSTVVVNASNIFNGGSIATPVPASVGSTGLNLVLSAVNSIINQGSITSSGSLTVLAPYIINALPAGVSGPAPVMQAVNNLQVLTGNLMNSGLLASVLGNISVANPSLYTTTVAQTLAAGTLASLVGTNTLPSVINLNNAGGVIRAMNGIVSVGGSQLSQDSILSLIGGAVEAQALHIDGGHGSVETYLDSVAAPVSISAGAAHFGTSSTMLTLSEISIAGDPTFFNDAGSITINGNIDVDEALSIVASRDILFAGAFTLSSADPVSGNGNEINLIAGADVSTFGGTASSTIPVGGNPLAPGQFLIVDGPSSTGGNILGADGIIDARATGANGNGGEVNLVAFANGPSTGGIRNLHVLTGGSGNGSNGNLNVVAGGSVDGVNAVIMDNIDTTGGVGMSGNIAVYAAQPLGVMVFGSNGVGNGGFFPGTSTAFGITLNNNVRSGGGSILVDTDGSLVLEQVSASALFPGRGAGDVTLNAATVTANAIAANGAVGAVGGGMLGSMGGSGGLGGDIIVNATNAILGTVAARGGDGGRGSDGVSGAAGMMGTAGGGGGSGGAGGTFTANVTSGLNLSTALDLDGGAGGAGGNGGAGGAGGMVGGAGGAGGTGGAGAMAGRAMLTSPGGNLNFDLASTASLEGGAGGAGGAGGGGAAGTTLGGSGGMSGAGGFGGMGGYLSMSTRGSGQILVDQVDLSGGSGGAGSQSGAGGAGNFAGSGGVVSLAGSGGMGGYADLRTSAGSITVNSNLDVSGGAGGNQNLFAGAGGNGTSLGGYGGAVMDAGSGAMAGLVFLTSTSGRLAVGSLSASGGAGGQQTASGGAGGSGQFAGAGGRVGNGGTSGGGGYINLSSLAIVDINGLVSADGGATADYSGRGGAGGASSGTGSGGAGGDVGGSGVISGAGGLVFVHGSTINLSGPITSGISARGGAIGDHNGIAGAGGSAGTNGMGGAGGDVGGIAFAGNGGLVFLTAPQGLSNTFASINVSGGTAFMHNGQAGAGGVGGITGGSGGAGGDVGMAPWGGSGGFIFADTDAGQLNAGNMWADGGPGASHNGRGGAGGAASGANSIGGMGGSIASPGSGGRGGLINLTSDSGDIASSFSITASGGGGGDQSGIAGAGGSGIAAGGSGGSVADSGMAMSGGQVLAFSLSGEINFNFVSSGGGVSGWQIGTGGAGGGGAMGGAGGNVGSASVCGTGGLIILNSVSGDIYLNGFIDASAGFIQGNSGTAGDGGAGTSGAGGNGGSVGSIAGGATAGFIYIDGNTVTMRPGSILWSSGGPVFGQGGTAGEGGAAGTNGMGGAGGSIGMMGNGGSGGTVIISGDNGVTLNANFLDVTGGTVYDSLGQSGAGGSGGLLSGAAGSGGNLAATGSGGAGGTLIIRTLSGTLDISSPLYAQGGTGGNDGRTAGAGGSALSPGGRGGMGGSVAAAGMGGRGGTVLLSAFGGTLDLDAQIFDDGGTGGAQQGIAGAGGAGGSTGGAGGNVGASGNGGSGGFVFGFAPNRIINVTPSVNAGLAGPQQGTAGAGGVGTMMNGPAGVVSPSGTNGFAGQTIFVGANPEEEDQLNAVAFTKTLASLSSVRKPMLEKASLVRDHGHHVLFDGEALFAPTVGECVIKTQLGTVRVAQGCIAYVVARSNETAVFSLHDSNSKKVSVTTGVAHVDLALGSALVLTNRTDKTLSQINPTPGLTFRNVREQKLSNGLKAIVGDFSILSALLNTSCLQDLRKSSCKDDRKSIERLIKNACILSYLTATRGVYRQQ